MEDIKELWKDPAKRKKILIIGSFVLLVITCLSVGRCTTVHSEPPEPEQPQLQEEIPEVDPEHAMDVDLTDAQLDAYAAMGEEEEGFLGLMASQLWTTETESSSLEVAKYGIRENGDAWSYAVCDVDAYDYEFTRDGIVSSVEARCAFVLLADGTYSHIKIETTRVTYPDGTESIVMDITSPLFKNGSGYQRAQAASELSIDGPSADMLSFIGSSTANLGNALEEYCSVYYPTASAAEWQGTFSYDRSKEAYTWTYRLDNTTRTLLTVTFDKAEKEYSIK